MTALRTLAIGLDGYDPALADEMIRAGHMPRIAALRESCARFDLEHGDAKRTGLAWEHVSCGRRPEAYGARRSRPCPDRSWSRAGRGRLRR